MSCLCNGPGTVLIGMPLALTANSKAEKPVDSSLKHLHLVDFKHFVESNLIVNC